MAVHVSLILVFVAWRPKDQLGMRILFLSIAFALVPAFGAIEAPLPEYRPASDLSGTVRSWGNDEMASLLRSWEEGFRRYHPAVHFTDNLHGPWSAMAGVYTGVADFAWMGHELRKDESMAFEWVFQYKP